MSKSQSRTKSSAARPRTRSPKTKSSAQKASASAPRPVESAKPKSRRGGTPKVPADLRAALAAALDKKAVDPIILDLRGASAFTDYFLIVSGLNLRQVHAIAETVQEALRKQGLRPSLVEGARSAEWVLIDYFDFIVHVFTPATREFYGLERLWGGAERIEDPAV